MSDSNLICLGVNHVQAPVELRERVAFTKQKLPDALRQAVEPDVIHEAAILSTCNRIEIYAKGCQEKGPEVLESFLHRFHEIPNRLLSPHLYCLKGYDVLKQLMRVTSSLDSLVLGEPQILGQVKEAYTQAREYGAMGPGLTRVFSQAFLTAKRVRTETDLGKNAVTVAYAAVELAQKVFGDLRGLRGALLGAGEMGKLAAQHFENKGALVEIAGRSSDLVAMLAKVDWLVASTSAEHFLIEPEMLKTAMRLRRYRPLFLIDIAVPRNIDPRIASIDNVYLYNIDDLSQVVAVNLSERQEAAKQAEKIIIEEIDSFSKSILSRKTAPIIQNLQSQSLLVSQQEVNKIKASLKLNAEQESQLEEFARQLTAKLFHEAVQAVKEAADCHPDLKLSSRA